MSHLRLRHRQAEVIERASADDVMSLLSDRHDPPMHAGAVLLLDVGEHLDDVARLTALLRHRLTAVPRLRQRLVDVPLGCGRPIWVDYPGFDFAEHFQVVRSPGLVTEGSVLAYAAEQLTTRLSRDRPLWSASLLVGGAGSRAALVLVFHHVLADGISGLSVLRRIADGAPSLPASDFPRRTPTLVGLAVHTAASRVRSVGQVMQAAHRLTSALTELWPSLRTKAAPCSLNRPTGPQRRLRTVRSDLAQTIHLAHHYGATVNDVIMAAITGALQRLLTERGEQIAAFVVSMPVSSRPHPHSGDLGNHSGAVPLLLSATGTFPARLELTAEATRAAKRSARGASTAALSPFFRLLARLGIYQHFVDHQRLIHTFVSDVQGPDTALTLLSYPITDVIPLAVATGNVTVAFTALSYAGDLTITISADPGTCPDLDRLQQELQHQLDVALGALPPTPAVVAPRGS